MLNGSYQFSPLGDSAVVIRFGERIDLEMNRKVKIVSSFLDQHSFHGMVEYIPAFTTVTVFYDPFQVYQYYLANAAVEREFHSVYQFVCGLLDQWLQRVGDTEQSKPSSIEIPVCYGGEYGPDLDFVASHNGLTPDEVVQIHSSAEYVVYMIGFAPGFPYIGGMSEKIATPRRSSPRLSIPPGTVGIAGMQTGVYPISTPGGWQLIGRTPLSLFRPKEDLPSLLAAGDIVQFKPISQEEFVASREEQRCPSAS